MVSTIAHKTTITNDRIKIVRMNSPPEMDKTIGFKFTRDGIQSRSKRTSNMRKSTNFGFGIGLFLSLLWSTSLFAADKTSAKEFIVEPATLLSLGFDCTIDGDDNRNATVAVT